MKILLLVVLCCLSLVACGGAQSPKAKYKPVLNKQETIVKKDKKPWKERWFDQTVNINNLYNIHQAMEDVFSSPLEFIGTGEWYGEHPYPSCAYKNDKILIIDNYCSRREITTFSVTFFSPERGYLKIYAYTESTKKAVSKIDRGLYDSFYVTSQPPPSEGMTEKSLSFDMNYRALRDYNRARAKLHRYVECYEGFKVDYMRGCTDKRISANYVDVHESFIKAPNERWYDFVRHIVAQRKHPWKKPKDFVATPEYWAGRAKNVARKEKLQFVRLEWPEFIEGKGPAPVLPLPDDTFLLVGTRRSQRVETPFVMKISAKNTILWKKRLHRKGFPGGFEAVSAIALKNGDHLLHLLAYPVHGQRAAIRLVRISPRGRIRWDWVGPWRGEENTPYANVVKLLSSDELILKGHINGQGQKQDWNAVFDLQNGTMKD